MRVSVRQRVPNVRINFAVQLLKDELSRRTELNSRYSLRAFAKLLKVHPSALSRILAEKQPLSVKAATTVVRQLKLSAESKRRFLISVIDEKRNHEINKVNEAFDDATLRLALIPIEPEKLADTYDLQAHAILELSCCDDFSREPGWISGRLGISEERAQAIVESLVGCGQLELIDGKLKMPNAHVSAIDAENSSKLRRKHQKDVLNGAINSLEKDAMDKRAHYALTVYADPSKVAEAKERIMVFLESMNDLLCESDTSQVYQVAIQLFPLHFQEVAQ